MQIGVDAMDLMTPANDRASIDYHYFIRGRLPEWDKNLADCASRSQIVRDSSLCRQDIPYGKADRQLMDIFPSNGGKQDQSVLVFLHGGYWRMMDKSQFSFIAPPFTSRGVTMVLVNYRLLPDVVLGDIVDDAHAAVEWIIHNIQEFGGKAENIVVCGHSAGAHLAAHVACKNRSIAGMIGISGVYDLEPLANSFLNEIAFLDRPVIDTYGIKSLTPENPCSGLFAYGSDEGIEFARQSGEITKRWRNQPSPVKNLILDANHITSIIQLGDVKSPLFNTAMSFIRSAGE